MNNTLELIQEIGKVLRAEMGLKQDQTVAYNQAFKIPPDDRLYISVGVLGGRTFAVKTGYENDPTKPQELQQVQGINRQELLSILVYSKDESALERNWEIPVALNSMTAQQTQEANAFKIGNIPLAMTDVSDQEAAARLYRYSLTVAVLVAYRKSASVEFFDSFQQPQIITNQ